ncbi:MAG: glycosyltransferase, partial [Bacteroidales bacterium]|nr:glycosyltransferase [Bacteroidales bacterium]
MNTKLILILPCYNEEPILYSTYEKLNTLFVDLIDRNVISEESRMCFVDDGSADKTWEIIESINKKTGNSIGIKLSRNFGHQFALLAGLTSQCGKFDAFITIDADLQDDISVIEKMVIEYQN